MAISIIDAILLLLAFTAVALAIARLVDLYLLRKQEHALVSPEGVEGEPDLYSPRMVEKLPEPAKRWFNHTLKTGTPLARAVHVRIGGTIRLNPAKKAVLLRANLLLAPPRGYVWRARMGSGVMTSSGYDALLEGRGAMRWWLFSVWPLVRSLGPDITRSNHARLMLETIYIPEVLLPQRGARWKAVDAQRATVRQHIGREDVEMTIKVDSGGRLLRVEVSRWKETSFVPFVIDKIAEERTFGGHTIPIRMRAGWKLGQVDQNPFYYPLVENAEYR